MHVASLKKPLKYYIDEMRPHIAKKYLPEQDMKLERLSDNINYILSILHWILGIAVSRN